MFWITLVVSLGAVGTRVGPRLQQFSDGQPLVQGRLSARHGQALACTQFTSGQCVQNNVIAPLCNYIILAMTSAFNSGTNIFLIKNVVYIDPNHVLRYQYGFSCLGLINFASHTSVTKFIASPFTSI